MGLMRRLLTAEDGKILLTEFAKLIKPTDLRPYLRRIRKYTKEEKKQVTNVKRESIIAKSKKARLDVRKPLTAFEGQSNVMLIKDPERHVKLMPARYAVTNELVESGTIADDGSARNHIDKEAK